jgi:hypothetical protein
MKAPALLAVLAASSNFALADMTIQSGQHETISNLAVEGSLMLDDLAGAMTSADIVDADISDNLELNGRSTINATDVTIYKNLFSRDQSRAVFNDSEIHSWAFSYGSSSYRLNDSRVGGGLHVHDSSHAAIRNTSIRGQILTFEQSVVTLVADVTDLSRVVARDESLIIIEGSDFNYGFGDIQDASGVLTGTWTSGQTFSFEFTRETSATIRLVGVGQVPAPSASALLGLGALGTLRRRRR